MWNNQLSQMYKNIYKNFELEEATISTSALNYVQ